LSTGFWLGRATDKQTADPAVRASNYWIAEFLDSDYRTTSAAGTRRLAVVLRDAARHSDDLGVRREIAAAVTLAGSLKGTTTSVKEFQTRFGLSEAACQAMRREMKPTESVTDRFRFDWEEFTSQVPYRSIELHSGAILTAPAPEFDEVFEQESADSDETVRFSTRGRIVSELLSKSK
jgi:hypothetical protein